MTQISLFNFQGQPMRCVQRDGETWFVARDVCDILEIVNAARTLSRLSPTMKGYHTVNTPGGPQTMAIISEAGLYKLIFTSRKEEAEHFADWVASDVLPTLRKHGAYILPDRLAACLENPELLGSLAKVLAAERRKRESLERRVAQSTPILAFADAVMESPTDIPVGDMAKLLTQCGFPIGRNTFFRWLRENGWLIRKNCRSYNMPTQRAVENGVIVIRESVWDHHGQPIIFRTPMITGKGQLFFCRAFVDAALRGAMRCPA